MHIRILPSVFVSLIVTGAISGCSDSPTALNSSRSARSGVNNPQAIVSPERAMLTDLTRALAIALADPKLRQSLKEDMREAPFREHKLELRKYLRGDRGARTRDAVARSAGRAGSRLLSLVDSVRPLELYMPVRAQRESWDGGESPIVLSQLAESDEIVAFNTDGKPVTLSRTIPPSQAVISLIPVETRFDQTIDLAKATNTNDKGGKTIGTLERCAPKAPQCGSSSTPNALHQLVACDVDCGGGGTVDNSYYGPGLYLEFSRLIDAKEPWFRGDPEVEVHIQGPIDTANPQYGADLSCSGEHAGDYRKFFDQNGNFWNGSVLLFSRDELDAYNAKFTQGFHVMFWEDDDTACTIKTDSDPIRTLVEQSAKGAGGAAAVKVDGGLGYALRAGIFLANLFSNASWLLTNDDFLGVAVDATQLGETFPDATHDILIGGTSNGRARLVYK